jgi:hypothetical protein
MRFASTVADGSSCPSSHSLNVASELSDWFALKWKYRHISPGS